MLRSLFALFLAFAAAGAFAVEPTPADPDAPQCEKAGAQASKPGTGPAGTSASSRPGSTAPVRARGASGRSTPRWHSLLPGMIR